MSHDKTVCLCMIVCNESRVIARALESVRGIIDYWVIADTGSSDSTPLDVLAALAGVPGELHCTEWVDFGHNRSEVLRKARGKADYILVVDADMVVNVGGPFKHKLTADSYEIRYTGDLDYSQRMLVADRHDWSYVGVTHEYIHAASARDFGTLPELTLTHHGDGGMRGDKFLRDVRLLKAALESDPGDARNVFYLAQSYRDLGQPAEALQWYEKRTSLGGWEEEAWYAEFQAARMRQRLGHEEGEVREALLRAYGRRPSRLEPLYEAVKACREREQYAIGYALAAQAGHGIEYPPDSLFIERRVYECLFLLEYGTCAYGMGRVSEAVEAFNRVMRNGELPAWVAESALRGRAMAVSGLYRRDATPPGRRNRFAVVVPFHNPGDSLRRCIESLLSQDYDDFRVLMIDDASSDGSADFVPRHDDRIHLVRNRDRRGLAANLHSTLLERCEADEIVVCVDGDDRLTCDDALSHVNSRYEEYDCWILYGQFQFADGSPGFSQPFASARDFQTLRQFFRTSHLRTFRAGLFHRIADVDPEYECLKDEAGEWLGSAVDAALMFPMLEMAGFDRTRFNERVLYQYDDEHDSNVHRRHRERQSGNYAVVSRKRPFARIESYRSGGSYAMAAGGNRVVAE